MSLTDTHLATIEDALSSPESPLSFALKGLGECSQGRGTCLVIEGDGEGETLIADGNWGYNRKETIEISDNVALVDLREGFGFKRLAILMEPIEDNGPVGTNGCALANAALSVTEELVKIARSWLTLSKVPAAEGLSSASAA